MMEGTGTNGNREKNVAVKYSDTKSILMLLTTRVLGISTVVPAAASAFGPPLFTFALW